MEQYEEDYNNDLLEQISLLEKAIDVARKSALNRGYLFIPEELLVRQAEEGEDLDFFADDPTVSTEHLPYIISGSPEKLAKVQKFQLDRSSDVALYQERIDILKGRLIAE